MECLTTLTLPLVGKVEVKFCSSVENPYSGDGRTMRVYITTDGQTEIWCDEDGSIIQIGASTKAVGGLEIGKDITQTTRRTIARRVVSAALPSKYQLLNLHPLEDHNSNGIWYFRWDDFSSPAKEDEMPPFIQIAMRRDGQLASFTNTLRRTPAKVAA